MNAVRMALQGLDLWLFHQGNGAWGGSWADRFFLWLTAPPQRIPLFLALWGGLFFFGGRRGRRAAVLALLAVALADQLTASVLKPWVDRVRPCFVLPETRLLLPGQSGSPSFPSAHAANSFAAATILFQVHPLCGVAGIAVAALVAFSRVYVGVHYPSDALFGAAVGVGAALTVQALYRWGAGLRRRR
jgi:undecaprenyl-diphosphatase